VRVQGHCPFGRTPLPNRTVSFVRVEGRWPFECAPLPDGAVDRHIGLSTWECTNVLHAVEPGSGASYCRPAPASIAIEPVSKDQDTHKQGPDTRIRSSWCFDHPFSRPVKVCTPAPTRQRCDTLSSSYHSHDVDFDKENLAGQKSTKHAHNVLPHISACTARSMSAGPRLPSRFPPTPALHLIVYISVPLAGT